ncbi:hypothetical protein PO124_10975 [Bacillus licheniformis]|nr:hypothetical protein [Bacillus licheniformis]
MKCLKTGARSEGAGLSAGRLETALFENIDLSYIVPYVNEQMLLGHHLGLKGKVKNYWLNSIQSTGAERTDRRAAERRKEHGWFDPAVVYQFSLRTATGIRFIFRSSEQRQHP